ncbi:MAG: asparagine synthase (glutamine-hydrolyzing) [Pirellulaceae bacterium]
MCGFVGFWGPGAEFSVTGEAEAMATHMSAALHHRGPDDFGVFVQPEQQLALAFRRLAIMDLSPAGHQPMTSASGRYVIAFNGEIYNHQEIRKQLRTHRSDESAPLTFRGHSDTEVLLAAMERWGITDAVERCVGMFAFAVWDNRTHELTLGRDRLGEKPLYYGLLDGQMVFASELKAIERHARFPSSIQRSALLDYLRHGYVCGTQSIYEDILRLPPASLLTVTRRQLEERRLASPRAYWSAEDHIDSTLDQQTDEQILAELQSRLLDSVRHQMIADVPVGAFLSGGIDSSLIVAMMRECSSKVKTFTIGFEEDGYDEAPYAKSVAMYLGTDHTTLYVTPEQARAVIPQLPEIYDEPFADSSQIPTFLVSQIAKQHVTVSLSGDGGDELFGGYRRYQKTIRLWHRRSWLPQRISETAAGCCKYMETSNWLPARSRHRLSVAASLLSACGFDEFYRASISRWKRPEDLVAGAHLPKRLTNRFGFRDHHLLRRMMQTDLHQYLPDDILTKVDRASMAVSLETRSPLLDHRVVEFARSLPHDCLIRDGKTKWALRQILYQYLPSQLVERPKMGFGVPLGAWLRGPLKDWADSLLSPATLQRHSHFHAEPIQQKWQQHLVNQMDHTPALWEILMFQAWFQQRAAQRQQQFRLSSRPQAMAA